jgi:16S rRNA (adenine1518-N6/adenine1519-N6)-dimethyltransferase
VDTSLASALPVTAVTRLGQAAASRLTVVAADALRLVPADISGDRPPDVLAANLPYNVAVPLLLGVLERFPSVGRGLVMVQAEVADRLASPPGGRLYGVPSVKVAWYASARLAGAVPRSVFWPQPNVDSSLVAFTRREPAGPPELRAAVFAAVDAAFAQRRKTVRTALSRWAGSPRAVERLARVAGVDPSARGETLDIAAFTRLAVARAAAPPTT